MGAKTPTKLRLRRPTYKCDECDKKFLSAQAMKTHHYCIHKMKVKPKSKGKLVNLLGKSVKQAPAKPRKDVDETPDVSDVRKIEYECPQCRNRFSIYFSAVRHIQRYHCVNSKGEKVPSSSPDVIKPLRVETCIKCQMRVRSTELHSCPNTEASIIAGVDMACACMGCQQVFPTVFMFDLHVSGLHSDSVETLFFPNIITFTMWKDQMESQSDVKYLILGKCNSRQTYRCTYSPPREDDSLAYFCPSSIVVKEYSKSIQVNFYKQHHGHSCKYKIPDKFKKYLSTEVMKNSIPSSTDFSCEEDDNYTKFKHVIEYITMTAFNADKETLKLLHGKALEMEKILRTDGHPKVVKKNMSDEQISKTLETLSGKTDDPLAIKTPGPEVEATEKKPIPVKDSTSTINSNSPIACFADSYKDFVDKMAVKETAFKPHIKPQFKNVRTYNRKKVVKTKIGQFKPSVSPKKDPVTKEDDEEVEFRECSFSLEKVKQEMDYMVIEQEDDCNILVLKV